VETVIQSRSRTVVIGPEQPFCIIGERINPTGRKAFQALLQAGDLSQLEVDVSEQVAGGADMLDVNVGDPLADEVALMGEAIRIVQSLTKRGVRIDFVKEHLGKGSYLYFDQFHHRSDELRAFSEFLDENPMTFRLMGATHEFSCVAFQRVS